MRVRSVSKNHEKSPAFSTTGRFNVGEKDWGIQHPCLDCNLASCFIFLADSLSFSLFPLFQFLSLRLSNTFLLSLKKAQRTRLLSTICFPTHRIGNRNVDVNMLKYACKETTMHLKMTTILKYIKTN